MGENTTFVDITKGFRRLGNFPSFSDEIFSTYVEADAYAKNGPTGRSNAFPGQLVRVLPNSADEEPMVYVIDKGYKLTSVTESVTTDSKLTVNFSYGSESGGQAITIVVPAGFVLNQMTIRFDEAFINDDAITIAYRAYNVAEGSEETPELTFILASGLSPQVQSTYNTTNIIVTDESESEFTIQSTMTFSEKTAIVMFIKTEDDPLERGRGILKLN